MILLALLKKNTDFQRKLINICRKITSNKTRDLEAEKELNEL